MPSLLARISAFLIEDLEGLMNGDRVPNFCLQTKP